MMRRKRIMKNNVPVGSGSSPIRSPAVCTSSPSATSVRSDPSTPALSDAHVFPFIGASVRDGIGSRLRKEPVLAPPLAPSGLEVLEIAREAREDAGQEEEEERGERETGAVRPAEQRLAQLVPHEEDERAANDDDARDGQDQPQHAPSLSISTSGAGAPPTPRHDPPHHRTGPSLTAPAPPDRRGP